MDKHDVTYIDCAVLNTNLSFSKYGGFGGERRQRPVIHFFGKG